MRAAVICGVAGLAACSSGGSGSLMFDGGIGPKPGETCSNTTSCAAGSYERCTLGTGTACQSRFLAQDGTSLACASCSDCQAALAQVGQWCAGMKPSDGGTGGSNDSMCKALSQSKCHSCCDQAHQDLVVRYNQLLQDCLCTSPGLCHQACRNSYCQTGATPTPFSNCDSCFSAEATPGGSCDNPDGLCRADATCAPYQACYDACP